MNAILMTAEGTDITSLLGSILPFLAIIVIFYFLLIRPESKRKKEMKKMLSELMVGDEVTTIGGIMGRVVNLKEDEVTIETGADKVRIVFLRSSISSKKSLISE